MRQNVVGFALVLCSFLHSSLCAYNYCIAPNQLEVTSTKFTLELVQTITRHGDRTALTVLPGSGGFFCNLTTFMLPSTTQASSSSIPRLFRKNYIVNKEVISPGNCNFGQLTARGLQQHIDLGGQLRNLYVNTYKFLAPNLDTSTLYIRSTDIYRTVQSAQGNIMGLFPSPGAAPNNVPIVDMYTMDLNNENMFSNGNICPRFNQLAASVTSEPAYVKFDQSFGALKAQLAKAFNVSVSQVPSWGDLFDAFNVLGCYNGALPNGISNDMVNTIYEISNWEYNYTLANVELTKLAIGSFVSQLVQAMQDKIAGNLPQKYFMYSAHDTTLAPLMTAFGVYDGQWPPYASHSQLELWSDASKNYYVQVKYQGVAHRLPGCTENNGTICTFAQFLKNISPYVPVNFAKECALSTTHTKDNNNVDVV